MNILVTYQYLSWKGGIEHVIEAQAELLQKQGHTLSVLSAEYLDGEPEEIGDGIPVYRLKCVNSSYKKFGIPFAVPYPTVKNYKILRSLINNADLINVHGHPYPFSFAVTLFAAISRKPLILTQHNTNIKASPLVNMIYWLVDRTIGRFNISRADAVVTVSNATRDYVVALVPRCARKTVTIYNGIDAELYKPVADKAELRKRLNIPADKFICFTVRRLTFKNGIDTLLQTAELTKNKDVVFLLGGSGPDLDDVKNYIAEKKLDNVTLLGIISDEDLPRYYAAADVFILPSRQGEGFPMVVLEAFAAGLPVIATRSGGHVEVIEDSRNGFLVDPESPAQIVQKIGEALEHDLTAISERCRKLVLERFTWPINVQNLIKIIEGLDVEIS